MENPFFPPPEGPRLEILEMLEAGKVRHMRPAVDYSGFLTGSEGGDGLGTGAYDPFQNHARSLAGLASHVSSAVGHKGLWPFMNQALLDSCIAAKSLEVRSWPGLRPRPSKLRFPR